MNIFIILMLAAMLAVVVSLAVGLFAMSKGGETGKKYSQKMMRARVIFQGLALLFFALALLTRGH